MTTITIRPPVIGIAVRRTRAKGLMPEQPATATTTAVIGDITRASPVESYIGMRSRMVEAPNCWAKSGTSGAKAKNGALPDPITTQEIEMKDTTTIMMA